MIGRSALWSNALLQLGPFHWGAFAPARAGRVAVGVILPLMVGWATGQIQYGAFASLGALPAAFASFHGVSRSRVAAVVAAGMGMAVSTFIGATVAAPPLLLLLIVIYGYVTGLAVCAGPRMSVVVLQWAVGLLIATGLPLPPAGAGVRGCLVLAGGLLQAALVAGTWTFRPGNSERAAVAASYRGLADYAAGLAGGTFGAPAPIAFTATDSLADPNPLLPGAARLMLMDLLEEAERIRASLAALAALAAEAGRSETGDRERLRQLTAEVSGALDLIAGELKARRGERTRRISDSSRRVGELSVPAEVGWRWAAEALLGQVRAVVSILRRLNTVPMAEGGEGIVDRAKAETSLPHPDHGIAAVILALRANVTLTTEAGRHALRLAVVAGLGEMLAQATHLPSGRWVVLTIFLVLKPDYASTLSRSIHRAVGTALGALLGVAAAPLGRFGETGRIVAAGASIASAYAMFDVSYLVFSVFLTSFIVVLLDILGVSVAATAQARLIDTAIGAALAILAFRIWPTWEGGSAPEKFARLFEAHRDYALALFRPLACGDSVDHLRLRALQGTARRARGDAEASAMRLANEPSHPPLTPVVAGMVIAATRRLAQAELALHALVVARRDHPAPGDDIARRLDSLAEAFGMTMSRLAVSFRTLRAPVPNPALRPLQARLRVEPGVDHDVLGVVDGLINALETLEGILRDHFASPESLSRADSHGANPSNGSAREGTRS